MHRAILLSGPRLHYRKLFSKSSRINYISVTLHKSFRCFLMVPPRGFLFLHSCGGCALKCEITVFLCGKVRLVKQHLLRQALTLTDAK